MEPFSYRDAALHAEEVALADIATSVGTPCYVYSRAHIEARWRAFDAAFGGRPHRVCYAVKANSNLAVLNLLARLGSGFDIVSVGELERVLAAGGDARQVVFSGVGKTEAEMRRALEAGIRCFNVESEGELDRLNWVARSMQRRAAVSLRVNPDVDAGTHPYIATGLRNSKFGIPMEQALAVYRRAARLPGIAVVGVDCHIGSQLTGMDPFRDALTRVLVLADALADAGIALKHLDLGGGLGIRYRDETPPAPEEYVGAILAGVAASRHAGVELLIEPGRAIVGNAGVLLTRVEYLKHGATRNFAVVDAAMNDLMRPSLYDAWQEIVPVVKRDADAQVYDVVGPVCESGDFLGRERRLSLAPGDLLAVRSAGAYGSSMSSNYNTRPRAAEVMVDGGRYQIVRRRETVGELFAAESVLKQ
ncbi:MAG TPA: diaminopimelate decarboxylase [Acidiferrobacterales bacterium]